jgi:hypothetical protein
MKTLLEHMSKFHRIVAQAKPVRTVTSSLLMHRMSTQPQKPPPDPAENTVSKTDVGRMANSDPAAEMIGQPKIRIRPELATVKHSGIIVEVEVKEEVESGDVEINEEYEPAVEAHHVETTVGSFNGTMSSVGEPQMSHHQDQTAKGPCLACDTGFDSYDDMVHHGQGRATLERECFYYFYLTRLIFM